MGFSIFYRSIDPLQPQRVAEIEASTNELCQAYTWLSCEPVCFALDDGHLMGSSKPAFEPDPDDVAAAELEGLPDGTVQTMLDVLSELSRRHAVDWELGHDYDPFMGCIRSGVVDSDLETQMSALAEASQVISEFSDLGREFDEGPPDDSDDDEDFPRTIRMF